MQIALRAAEQSGDPHPTRIEVSALGTRNAVLAVVSGDQIGAPYGTAPGYEAIVMHGHFSTKDVPVPGNAPPGTVTTMVLVVNVATGEGTDSGMGNNIDPDLSKLGPVTTIPSH